MPYFIEMEKSAFLMQFVSIMIVYMHYTHASVNNRRLITEAQIWIDNGVAFTALPP